MVDTSILTSVTDWRTLALYLHANICSACPSKRKGEYRDCEICQQALKIKELTEKELQGSKRR